MSDTKCPGCGRANTMDPVGICHACGHGRVDPEAAALREQIREIVRVRDQVLGGPGERFQRSGIPGAIRRAVRAAVAEVVDRAPTPEELEERITKTVGTAVGQLEARAAAPPALTPALGALQETVEEVLRRLPARAAAGTPPLTPAAREERAVKAIHEAAHAVVALVYGATVELLTIDAGVARVVCGRRADGATNTAPLRKRYSHGTGRDPFADGVAALAGPVAQEYFAPTWGGAEQPRDLLRVAADVETLTGDRTDARAWANIARTAASLVAWRWDAIVRVAAALLC